MKLDLPDGDFLLIDFRLKNAKKAVILCHGLEGNSKSHYNNTCAAYFLKDDFSVFAWNNRSCGGVMNVLPQLYHHGSFQDLEAVVRSVLNWGFDEIYLIGFSLGGAQILNYLGNREIDAHVRAAMAISTPIELKASQEKISHGFNRFYSNQMIKKLRKKILLKAQKFPGLDSEEVSTIKTFDDVARVFLVPVYHFRGLDDYFAKASPGAILKNITTPVLILNALDDPIIGKDAYPADLAENSKYVYLETPQHGGHCAFPVPHSYFSYPEIRALKFFEKISAGDPDHN